MSAIQVQNIRKFLQDSSYTHTEEWLTACIDWINQNYNPLTDTIIKQQVLEQWKDVNLTDLGSTCLPDNLAAQKCTKLRGRYGLQMNSVQDIGESAYNQWNRLKKLENENTSVEATDSTTVKNAWEPKPRRCLYLTLTDGSQTVFAMELSPIPSLSLNLKPGVKILIMGPIECRRGILQLNPINVKVIGGEVEELVHSNSTEAILREILHYPADAGSSVQNVPHPPSTVPNCDNEAFPSNGDFDDDDIFMEIDESLLLASASETTMNTQNRLANAETQRIIVSQSQMNPPPSRSVNNQQDSTKMPPPPPSQSKLNQSTTIPAKKITKFNPPPPKSTAPAAANLSVSTRSATISRPSATTNSTEKVVVQSGFQSAKTLTNKVNAKSKPKQLKIDGYMKPMPVIIKPPTPVKVLTAAELGNELGNEGALNDDTVLLESDDDDSLMEIIEGSFAAQLEQAEKESEENQADKPSSSNNVMNWQHQNAFNSKSPATGVVFPIVSTPHRFPIMVSKQPYVFLKQVCDNIDTLTEKNSIVQIKACVATVVSNIQVSEGSWSLTVCLNDGTGFLNCRVAPEILSSIIGFNPYQMKQMKSTKTPEAKQKISKGMKNLTTTLVHMNAIFGIELGPEPLIVTFSDVMLHHMTAMKQRICSLP